MGSHENSQIRINALLKELDRQQLEVKKKKDLIRVIVLVIILASVATCSFVYNNDKNKTEVSQVIRKSDSIVKPVIIEPKQVKTYQLVFENLNQYPLARFFNEKEALSFQEEIKSLHLPKTRIHVDSLDGKERVLTISSNYRYYIQFGIFKKQLISALPERMVYLHQLKDKDLFKYRLGPFAMSTKAEKLVRDLKIKDYLILEVSK